jgi:hypothetical protein
MQDPTRLLASVFSFRAVFVLPQAALINMVMNKGKDETGRDVYSLRVTICYIWILKVSSGSTFRQESQYFNCKLSDKLRK